MSFQNQHKELSRKYSSEDAKQEFEVTCSIIEFNNKFMITLAKDGETDTTFDIQLPMSRKNPNNYDYDYDDDDDQDDGLPNDLNEGVRTNILIGNNGNIKNQVMATQIGKLMTQFNPGKKNSLILTSCGRIFDKSENVSSTDFMKLTFVLELVKDCYIR